MTSIIQRLTEVAHYANTGISSAIGQLKHAFERPESVVAIPQTSNFSVESASNTRITATSTDSFLRDFRLFSSSASALLNLVGLGVGLGAATVAAAALSRLAPGFASSLLTFSLSRSPLVLASLMAVAGCAVTVSSVNVPNQDASTSTDAHTEDAANLVAQIPQLETPSAPSVQTNICSNPPTEGYGHLYTSSSSQRSEENHSLLQLTIGAESIHTCADSIYLMRFDASCAEVAQANAGLTTPNCVYDDLTTTIRLTRDQLARLRANEQIIVLDPNPVEQNIRSLCYLYAPYRQALSSVLGQSLNREPERPCIMPSAEPTSSSNTIRISE